MSTKRVNADTFNKVSETTQTELDPATNLPKGSGVSNKGGARVSKDTFENISNYLSPGTPDPFGSGTVSPYNPDEYDFQLKSDVDNRQLRADNQSMTEVLANATGRFLGTALTKTLSGIGYLGGAVAALATWDSNKMLDNFFSGMMTDVEDDIKEALPVYKTNKYLNGNLLEQMGTAGFWFDDVVDGAAFMASAYIGGLGYLKAASKIGAYSKLARAFQAQSYAAKTGKIMAGGMKIVPKLSKAVRLMDFATLTLGQTVSEAAFEAADTKRAIMEGLQDKLATGEVSGDEAQAIATDAAKGVFASNILALGVSNGIFNSMVFDKFRGIFKVGKKTKFNWADPAKAIEAANRPLTVAKYAKAFAKNSMLSIASEGFYEENIQQAAQRYFQDMALNGDSDPGVWENFKSVMGGMIDNLSDAEGQKSIMLGAIIGLGPGGVGGIKEAREEAKSNRVMAALIDGAIPSVEDDLSRYMKTEDVLDEEGKPTGKKRIKLKPDGKPQYDIFKTHEFLARQLGKHKTIAAFLKAANSGNQMLADYIAENSAAGKVLTLAKAGFAKSDIKNWFDYKAKETEESYKKSNQEGLIPQLKEDTENYKSKVDTWYNLYDSIMNNHAGLFDFGNTPEGQQLKNNAIAAQFEQAVLQTYWREQKDQIQEELDKLDDDAFNKVFDTYEKDNDKTARPGTPFREKTVEGDDYTRANMEDATRWLEERFGKDVAIKIQKDLLKDKNGREYFSQLLSDGFLLTEGMEEGSEYHEAFHRVSLHYLTDQQRANLYNAAVEKYGDELSEEQKNNPAKLEEFLAEKFREFVMAKDKGVETSAPKEVKNWFQKMYEYIKRVFTGNKAITQDEVDVLFDKIESGEYKDFLSKSRAQTIEARRKKLKEKNGQIDLLLEDSYNMVKELENPKSDSYTRALKALTKKKEELEKIVQEQTINKGNQEPVGKKPMFFKKDGSTTQIDKLTAKELIENGYEEDTPKSKLETSKAKTNRLVYKKKLDDNTDHYIYVEAPNKEKNHKVLRDIIDNKTKLFRTSTFKQALEDLHNNNKDIAKELKNLIKNEDGEIQVIYENGKLSAIRYKNALGEPVEVTGKDLPTNNGNDYTYKEHTQLINQLIKDIPGLKDFIPDFGIVDFATKITEEFKKDVLQSVELLEAKNQVIERFWKEPDYDNADVFDSLSIRNLRNTLQVFFMGRPGMLYLSSEGNIIFNPTIATPTGQLELQGEELIKRNVKQGDFTFKELGISVSKDSVVDMDISEDGTTITLYGEKLTIPFKNPLSAIEEDNEGNPTSIEFRKGKKKVVIKDPLIVNKVAVSLMLNEMAKDIVFFELLTDEDAGYVELSLNGKTYNIYRAENGFVVYNKANPDKALSWNSKEVKAVLDEMNKMSSTIVADLIKRGMYHPSEEQRKGLVDEIRTANEILSRPTPEEVLAAADAEEIRRTKEDENPEFTFVEGESLQKLDERIRNLQQDIMREEAALRVARQQVDEVENKEDLDKLRITIRNIREKLTKLRAQHDELQKSYSSDLEVEGQVKKGLLEEQLAEEKEAIEELTKLIDKVSKEKDSPRKAQLLSVLNERKTAAIENKINIEATLKDINEILKPTEEKIKNRLATILATIEAANEEANKIEVDVDSITFEIDPNDNGYNIITFTERGVTTPYVAVSYVQNENGKFVVRDQAFEDQLIRRKKEVLGDTVVPVIDLGDFEDSSQYVKDWWAEHRDLYNRIKSEGLTVEIVQELINSVDQGTWNSVLDNIPIRLKYQSKEGKEYKEGLYYHTSYFHPGYPESYLRSVAYHSGKSLEEVSKEYRVQQANNTRYTRAAMLMGLAQGEEVKLGVKTLSKGAINSTKERRPVSSVIEKVEGKEGLRTAQIEVITISKVQRFGREFEEFTETDEIIDSLKPGNIFWVTNKTANGEKIPIKLNPKKIKRNHAEFIFKLYQLIGKNKDNARVSYKGPEIKGNLSPQYILDILVPNGKTATSIIQKNYPLADYLKDKQLFLEGKKLTFGQNTISDITKATTQEKNAFLDWMTTTKNYAISDNFMTSGLPSFMGDFQILDLKYNTKDDNYTSFVLKNGFLETDVDEYRDTKSVTKNPAILFGDYRSSDIKVAPGTMPGVDIRVKVWGEKEVITPLDEYIKKEIENSSNEEGTESEVKKVTIKKKRKVTIAKQTNTQVISFKHPIPAGSKISIRVEKEGQQATYTVVGTWLEENGKYKLRIENKGDSTTVKNALEVFIENKLNEWHTLAELEAISEKMFALHSGGMIRFSSEEQQGEEIYEKTLSTKAELELRKSITDIFDKIAAIVGGKGKKPTTQKQAAAVRAELTNITNKQGYKDVLSYTQLEGLSAMHQYLKENFEKKQGEESEEEVLLGSATFTIDTIHGPIESSVDIDNATDDEGTLLKDKFPNSTPMQLKLLAVHYAKKKLEEEYRKRGELKEKKNKPEDDPDLLDFLKEADSEEIDTGNVPEAIKWLEDKLGKDVTVLIHDGLIKVAGNRVAFGQTTRDAITLSTRMAAGTEYHEAFHRVSLLYLNEKDRQAVYRQAARENPALKNASKRQIEEYLAERFRDYMLTKNANLSTKSFKGKMGKFFKNLWDIIYRFYRRLRSMPQYDINTLFSAIDNGRFVNSKIAPDSALSEDESFNRLFKSGETELTYVQDESDLENVMKLMFKELVDASIHNNSIKLSNTNAVNMLNFGMMFDSIKRKSTETEAVATELRSLREGALEDETGVFTDLLRDRLGISIKDKDTLLKVADLKISRYDNQVAMYNEILANKDFFTEKLSDYIYNLGIVTNRDELDIEDNAVIEKDDDTGEELSTMATWNDVQFTYNARDNVAANIKLLLATLRSSIYTDNRTGLPLFENYSTAWGRVMHDLRGLTDKASDIISFLNDQSLTSAFYSDLLEALQGDELLLTQFKRTVNQQIVSYTKAIAETETSENGETTSVKFKFLDPKLYSSASMKLKEWGNAFALTSTVFKRELGKDAKADLGEFKKLGEEFNRIVEYYKNNHTKNPAAVAEKVKSDLRNNLNKLGIQISKLELDSIINKLGPNFEIGFEKLTKGLSKIYLPSSSIYKYLSNPKAISTKEFNKWSIFNNTTVLKHLANILTESSVADLGFSMLGPEGNSYYTVSQHTYQSNIIDKLRKGDQVFIAERLEAVYNRGSKILERLRDDEEFRSKFGIRTLSAFATSDSSFGKEFHKMTDIEEYLLRINSRQNDLIMFPTPADRKFTHFFEGLNPLKGYIHGDFTVDPRTAEQLVGYLEDEENRVKLTKKQVKQAIEGKKVNLVEDLHYETVYPGTVVGKNDVILVDDQIVAEGTKLTTSGKMLKQKGRFVGNGTKFTHFVGYKVGENKVGFITRVLNERLQEELKTANNLGIISLLVDTDGNITGIKNKLLSSDLIDKYKGIEYANTTDEGVSAAGIILDNMVNTIMSSIENHKLFIGDPAAFKDSGALLKRLPLYTSTGDNTRNDFPSHYMEDSPLVHSTTYNTITVDDEIFKSDNYENLVTAHTDFYMKSGLFDNRTAAEKQARLKLKGYTKANRTDGQTFITPDMYKAILVKMGMFTDEVAAAFKVMLNEELTPTEKDLKVIANVFMQPLKMLYLNNATVEGHSYPIIDKMSMAVLFPRMIKGTQLEQVYNDMLDNNVHQLKFKSAQKVGNTDVKSAYNDGQVESLTGMKITPQEFEFLRFQLETSPHNKALNLVGTQFKKVGIANVDLEATYKDGRRGEDIVKEIHTIFNTLADLGLEEFKDSLGFTGEFEVSDPRAFMEYLRDEARKAGLSSKEVESFKMDESTGKFNLQLDAKPSNRRWVQSRLLSILKKATIDLRMPGGAFIQISDFGFRDIRQDNSLQMNLKEGYLEAAVSVSLFKDIIPDYKAKTHEERVEWLENNSHLTQMMYRDPDLIGYRIPTQGQNSEYSVKIKKFLPAEVGDVIMLPKEGPTIGGFDFDIDKLYIIRHHYTNRGEKVKFFDDTNSTVEDRYTKYIKALADKDIAAAARSLKQQDITHIYNREHAKAAREAATTRKNIISSQLRDYDDAFKSSGVGIQLSAQFEYSEEVFNRLSAEAREYYYMLENSIKNLKGVQKHSEYLRLTSVLQNDANLSNRDIEILKDLQDSYEVILSLLNQKEAVIKSIVDSGKAMSKELYSERHTSVVEGIKTLFDENSIPETEELKEVLLEEARFIADTQGLITLEEFESMDIFRQNTKRALQNKLVDNYMVIHTDENQKIFSTQPLDYGASQLAQLADEIAKLEGVEEHFASNPLGTLTPSYQVDVKVKYSLGENLGRYALASAHYNLGQLVQMKLNTYLGIGNVITVDGVDYSDLSQIYGAEETAMDGTKIRMPISEWYSALIDGHVDLATNPFITNLNLTNLTSNPVSLLIRAGVGINTFKFISQPILKLASRLENYHNIEIGNNIQDPIEAARKNYLKKLDALKNTDKFNISEQELHYAASRTAEDVTEYDVARAFDDLQLMDDIKIGGKPERIDAKHIVRQLEILNVFEHIQKYANQLGEAVLSSRVDTKKFGNNVSQVILFQDRMQSIKRAETVGEAIQGYTNSLEETFLKGQIENGLDASPEALKHLILEATPSFRSVMKVLMENTGRGMYLKASEVSSISAAVYSTLSGQYFSKTLDRAKLIKMFTGEDSTASKVFKIKSGEFLPQFKENALIQAIVPDFGSKERPHSIKVIKPDGKDSSTLISAWEDLYYSEDQKAKDFAIELFQYAFATSGFNKSVYSIYEYIPDAILKDEGYNKFISDKLDELQDTSALLGVTEGEGTSFMEELYLNSWDNDTLIPDVSNYKNIDYLLSGQLLATDNFSLKLGVNKDNVEIYKPFVKRNVGGDTVVYKYAGILHMKDNTTKALYYPVDKKGFRKGYNIVKEYWVNNSLFKSNKPFSDSSAKSLMNDKGIDTLASLKNPKTGEYLIQGMVSFSKINPETNYIDYNATYEDEQARLAAERAAARAIQEDGVKKPFRNVDSYQEGLEFALTNPVYTSPKGYEWTRDWSASQNAVREYMKEGIKYNGQTYKDAEQAYQATVKIEGTKNTRLKPEYVKNDKPDYDKLHTVMVSILRAKFEQYPGLIKKITKEGGIDYLNTLKHQPTNGSSYWETDGEDGFIRALKEAYMTSHIGPGYRGLYSGGAKGADTYWGNEAKKLGIPVTHWYVEGGMKPTNATHPVNKVDYTEGKYRVASAMLGMFGFKPKNVTNDLLIRDWSQVKHSDAVFAVAEIGFRGDIWKHDANKENPRKLVKQAVQGGTGYAVEMAIQQGKPVHVYNTVEKDGMSMGWYTWDKQTQSFVSEETPTLTPRFAGIGTRELTDEGKRAISDVYSKTFKGLSTSTKNGATFKESLFRGQSSKPVINEKGELVLRPSYESLSDDWGVSLGTEALARSYGKRRSNNSYIIEVDAEYLDKVFPLRDSGTKDYGYRNVGDEGEQRLNTKENVVIPEGHYKIHIDLSMYENVSTDELIKRWIDSVDLNNNIDNLPNAEDLMASADNESAILDALLERFETVDDIKAYIKKVNKDYIDSLSEEELDRIMEHGLDFEEVSPFTDGISTTIVREAMEIGKTTINYKNKPNKPTEQGPTVIQRKELEDGHVEFSDSRSLVNSVRNRATKAIGSFDPDTNTALAQLFEEINNKKTFIPANKVLLNRDTMGNEDGLTLTPEEKILLEREIRNGSEFIVPDRKDNFPFLTYMNARGARYTVYYTKGKEKQLDKAARVQNRTPEQAFMYDKVQKVSYGEAIQLHSEGKALFSMRFNPKYKDQLKGLSANHHFGNPFTGSGRGNNTIGVGKNDSSVESVEAASRAYKDWLLYSTYPEDTTTPITKEMKANLDLRREWILNKLNSGKYDGVKLGYYASEKIGPNYYSHADALAEVIDLLAKARKQGTTGGTIKAENKLTTPEEPLSVYTDGSAIKGEDFIGYGVWFEYKGKEYSKSGVPTKQEYKNRFDMETDVSNVAMELQAAVEALRAFKDKGEHLDIRTDSQNVVKWFSGEFKTRTVYTESLVNEGRNLIQSIESNGGSVKFTKIKGHSKTIGKDKTGNDKADNVAHLETEHDTLQQVYEDNKEGIKVGEEDNVTVSDNNEMKFNSGITVPTGRIKLNEGQHTALQEIADFIQANKDTHTLIGYAGTGKTTVLNILNEYILRARTNSKVRIPTKVIMTTPTHRANSVLRTKGVKNVQTIHSLLGLRPDLKLEEFDPHNIKFAQVKEAGMPEGGLLVIDESSMLNNDLFELIVKTAKEAGTQVLFVGDDAQLGPVKQTTISKSLIKGGTQGRSVLTKVMRTGDNPLLEESMRIRKVKEYSYSTSLNEKGEGVVFTNNSQEFMNSIIEQFKSDEFKANPLHVRIVAALNATVDGINTAVRNRLFGKGAPEYVEGDILMGYENVLVKDEITGELIPSIQNGIDYIVDEVSVGSAVMLNEEVSGYIVNIRDISNDNNTMELFMLPPSTSPKTLAKIGDEINRLYALAKSATDYRLRARYFAEASAFKNSFANNFKIFDSRGKLAKTASIKHGYAHTIHKSQGGTYTYTYIADDSVNEFKSVKERPKLRYVAVTRSEKASVILNRIQGDDSKVELAGNKSEIYTPMSGLAKEGEELKKDCNPA